MAGVALGRFPVDAVVAAAVRVAGVALGDMAFTLRGMALGDIDLHFAWQAWHLVTWIVTLRGRRGTYGTGLALVARLFPVDAVVAVVAIVVAAVGVAGVALDDIDLQFVWQAWHLATSTFTLRGRRGTW